MPARPSARRRTTSTFVSSGIISPSGPGKTYSEGDASMAASRHLRATRHEPGNGALRDVEAELEKLAVNAWRASEWIRERHGAYEIGKLRADRRSTRSPAA